MIAEERQSRLPVVTEDEARQELERLLSDDAFRVTDRAQRILLYLAERYFAGEVGGIKAYAIALDVLERSSNFDPNSDPIVRIELSRLRHSLDAYYQTCQNGTGIELHIPTGRYLLTFSRATADSSRKRTESPVSSATAFGEGAHRRGPSIGLYASLLAVPTFLGTLMFAMHAQPEKAVVTDVPLVSFTGFATDAAFDGEAQLLNDHMISEISKFRTVAISTVDQTVTGAIDQSGTGSVQRRYDIVVKYSLQGDQKVIRWQVLDADRKTVVAVGAEFAPNSEALINVIPALAVKFVASRGVIGNTEIRDFKTVGATDPGNSCVLWAEYVLNEGAASDEREAADCLERTLKSRPNNAAAAAVLARLLLETQGADDVVLAKAWELTERATYLDPSADRTYIALMLAHFYSRNEAVAIDTGWTALSNNSSNPHVLAKFALILFLSGYWEGGVALADKALGNPNIVPRDAKLVQALDSYRRDDFQNASRLAQQIARADVLSLSLRAAALGHLGDGTSRGLLTSLSKLEPRYAAQLPVWLDQHLVNPQLAASIEQGITRAERIAW